jgi:tripartite-type tricarboxylate transporter receptor subunit TctC
MTSNTFRSTILGVCAASMALVGLAAPARAADFYAGKKVDFIIGGDAGGGYDIYARLIARHLSGFLPGSPLIVPRNMPGAGSGTAAASIYRLGAKDGTVIGALFPGVIVGPLFDDRPQNLFDPTKFNYLGTADSGTRVCITGASSKVKTFEDAQKMNAVIGASAAGGSTRDYAAFHKNAMGAQFTIVNGYKGTTEIMLAMERGEVDGLCGLDWTSLKSQKPNWLRDKTVNILVQDGMETEPELNALGVPSVWKYIRNDTDKRAVELIVSQQVFGRPYVAPPGVPAEQIQQLRDGLMAVMKDKAFLEDAEQGRVDVTPLSGEKVQAVVEKLYAEPKEVVQRAKELITP